MSDSSSVMMFKVVVDNEAQVRLFADIAKYPQSSSAVLIALSIVEQIRQLLAPVDIKRAMPYGNNGMFLVNITLLPDPETAKRAILHLGGPKLGFHIEEEEVITPD